MNRVSQQTSTKHVEKIGRELSSNMRALRLTLKLSSALLSRGVSARNVVITALDITETYCARLVHIDISALTIVVSQDRGIDYEPITLVQTVIEKEQNNMLVQELEELARKIVQGMPLRDAEQKYEQIIESEKKYPAWLKTLGNAGVAAGVTLLFTSSPLIVAITFVIGCIIDKLIHILEKRLTPPFFIQAAASAMITLIAISIASLGRNGFGLFAGINPTLIVVGVVVMLVAGLTIYATAEDAIDQFYITASARLVKTFVMTAGIVMGIMIGLGIARALGESIVISPDPIPLNSDFPVIIAGVSVSLISVLGAIITSAAWTIYTQSSRAAIIWAGLIGGTGWTVYLMAASIGEATANGLGAIAVGFIAAIVARLWKTPSIAIVDAAVVPLVPGLALYNGLMQFTGPNISANVNEGSGYLLTAISVALAIAAGATFGSFLGRPVRSQILRVRKFIPQGVSKVRQLPVPLDSVQKLP